MAGHFSWSQIRTTLPEEARKRGTHLVSPAHILAVHVLKTEFTDPEHLVQAVFLWIWRRIPCVDLMLPKVYALDQAGLADPAFRTTFVNACWWKKLRSHLLLLLHFVLRGVKSIPLLLPRHRFSRVCFFFRQYPSIGLRYAFFPAQWIQCSRRGECRLKWCRRSSEFPCRSPCPGRSPSLVSLSYLRWLRRSRQDFSKWLGWKTAYRNQFLPWGSEMGHPHSVMLPFPPRPRLHDIIVVVIDDGSPVVAYCVLFFVFLRDFRWTP